MLPVDAIVMYLSKILPLCVLPLGLTVGLVAAGVVFRRRFLGLAGLALLWFSAMPVTSDQKIGSKHKAQGEKQ